MKYKLFCKCINAFLVSSQKHQRADAILLLANESLQCLQKGEMSLKIGLQRIDCLDRPFLPLDESIEFDSRNAMQNRLFRSAFSPSAPCQP